MNDIISIEELVLHTSEGPSTVAIKIAPQGIAMKTKSTNTVITLEKNDIKEIKLFRSTQKINMRIYAKHVYNIKNITDSDSERIKQYCSEQYHLKINDMELQIEDVNKGSLMISGNFLEFRSFNNKLIFDIPLKDIDNVHQIRNEMCVSFKENKNSTTELKFVTENINLVGAIKERNQSTKSKEIVTFEALQSVLPRGKNTFVFYMSFFKMVGSTYEHKIFYKSVKKIFYLEKESKESYLAINIDPPIRQGQTSYAFIVMVLNNNDEEVFDILLSDEDILNFPELKRSYTGSVGESFLSVLKSITNCKAIRTDAFVTLNGHKSLKCSVKAFDGHLYPLDKYILFLPKAILVSLTDIKEVEFSRVNLSAFAAKTFDMKVIAINKECTFNSLPKEDFGQLEQYFSEKNIKIVSEVIDNESVYSSEEEEEEEDDDLSYSDE